MTAPRFTLVGTAHTRTDGDPRIIDILNGREWVPHLDYAAEPMERGEFRDPPEAYDPLSASDEAYADAVMDEVGGWVGLVFMLLCAAFMGVCLGLAW